MPTQLITTIEDLRRATQAKTKIAFVPTMGNLHAGHIDLVKAARNELGTHPEYCVVVSIFVNPLQFGPSEDFASYPRTLEADLVQLEGLADIVFAPDVVELYPEANLAKGELGQTMTITPPPLANTLCGLSRPGHFSGVATVVMKLFQIVQPTSAYFGKKDFQQLRVIQELVKQFHLPIEIYPVDTRREADGLAMSSRNGYLNKMERAEAVRLHKVLIMAKEAILRHESLEAIEQQCSQYLTQLGWIVDYVAIRSTHTLLPPSNNEKEFVILAAAKLGKTRLIDNITLQIND